MYYIYIYIYSTLKLVFKYVEIKCQLDATEVFIADRSCSYHREDTVFNNKYSFSDRILIIL